MVQCSLCQTSISSLRLVEGENAFCCAGCKAVYSILSTQNKLANFQDHPIFLQALRSGLISNPALVRPTIVPDQEKEKVHFEIANLWCPACAELITLLLMQEKGMVSCVVDYATDLAAVEFMPHYIGKEKIFGKIEALGYKPQSLLENEKVSRSLYLRFMIAAFCALNIMMFSYPIYAAYFHYDHDGYGNLFAWASFFATLPVITYCSWPLFRRFFYSTQLGVLGMETLFVIGITTAFGLSTFELFHQGIKVYFDSLSVIVTFMLLGKIIESKAKFSAKNALIKLVRAMPRKARKHLGENHFVYVPIKEIHVGDAVTTFSGEKIVLDGKVIAGRGLCDESLMTGEARPILKEEESKVVAGSILAQGELTYRVSATVEESTLSKIIDMVNHELGHKMILVKFTDQVVRYFVPAVLLLALLTGWMHAFFYSMSDGILAAVSVLLISCPCALGIAIPLAEAHLINSLTTLGALVRNRNVLSLLGKETTLVFDKTGTITEGRYVLLKGTEGLSGKQRQILKGLAVKSTHPVALAVAAAVAEEPLSLEETQEMIGLGMQGKYSQEIYYLGSKKFLQSLKMDLPLICDKTDSESRVYFFTERECLAELTLGDKIRPEAKQLLRELAPAKTVLLSGDGAETVEAVARLAGFQVWRSECTPLEKKQFIENLKSSGEIVCMIGDGINDAPALTSAHVAISVVSATDISVQVSDLLLTTAQLLVIPKIRRLAQQGRNIAKQNLFWAFFYNVMGIGLAMVGYLNPLFAAFAMVASSLMVLFNAQRIKG